MISLNKTKHFLIIFLTLSTTSLAQENFEFIIEPAKKPNLVEKIETAFSKKDFALACKLEDISKTHRRQRQLASDFFSTRGLACLRDNNLQQAENDFKKALTFRASNSDALFGLGQLYALADNHLAARDFMEQADWFNKFNKTPLNEFKERYAAILEKTGERLKAENIYRDILKGDPNNEQITLALGRNLLTSGKGTEAEVIFRKFPQDNLETQLLLAEALLAQPTANFANRKAIEAANIANYVIELAEKNPQAYFIKVKAFIKNNALEEAEESANLAASLFPDDGRFKEQIKQIEISKQAAANIEKLKNLESTLK